MAIIYNFKKGDAIVRTEPAKEITGCDIITGKSVSIRDRSYLGEKFILIGVANGQIYLKRTCERE